MALTNMIFTLNLFMLSLTVIQTSCYSFGSAPLKISMDKKFQNQYDWVIYENQTIGSTLGQAKINLPIDVTFTLEPIQCVGGQLPITINTHSGTILLMQSLKGRAGEKCSFHIIADDGSVKTKLEIPLHIGPLHIQTVRSNIGENEVNHTVLKISLAVFTVVVVVCAIVLIAVLTRSRTVTIDEITPKPRNFNVIYTA